MRIHPQTGDPASMDHAALYGLPARFEALGLEGVLSCLELISTVIAGSHFGVFDEIRVEP